MTEVVAVRKGSEYLVDGKVFMSRSLVDKHPAYVSSRLDELVRNGAVRAIKIGEGVFYSKEDLDRVFPIEFIQPE